MSEMESDLSGDETADVSVENQPQEDDTSIRAQVLAALEEQSPPDQAVQAPDTPSDDGPDEATVAEDDAPQPPQSWTAAERETWEELPQTARDAISRREREFQAGLKSDAELQKVIAPLAERLKDTDVHVDQYVGTLMQADEYIRSNPLGAVAHLIQQYDLHDQVAKHFGGKASRTEPEAAPAESDRIAQLEQQLAYQSQLAQAQREWDSFVATHPDANDLREVIASKLGANPNLTYASAYEQARELVSSFNGTRAQQIEAASVEAATKASAKAGKLKLPSGRAAGSAPASGSSGDLRDDIVAAMRSAGVRT